MSEVHVGMVVGARVVIAQVAPPGPRGGRYWLCRCKCGRENAIPTFKVNEIVAKGLNTRCGPCAQAQRRAAEREAGEMMRGMRRAAWWSGGGLYSVDESEELSAQTLEDLTEAFGETLPPPPASLSIEPAYWVGGVA